MIFTKERWKLTQEITSVITGVGTLFLGIATVWITVRVSGLEDYFRSEIAYRNEQLVALQKNIDSKNTELKKIQDQVAGAQIALKNATAEGTVAKVALDTRIRAQVYTLIAHAGYFVNMINYNASENHDAITIEIGQLFDSAMQRVKNDLANATLKPHIEMAEIGFHKKCPDIFERRVEVPAAKPGPVIGPQSGTSKAAYEEFTRHWKEYVEATKVRRNAIAKGFDAFYSSEAACLCSILAIRGQEKEICKEAKFY